jgi:probable DNA metabolism protein
MERLVQTVQGLRREGFNGYIHLKCVPYASRRLIRRAGRFADRLSVNIELPSEKSLRELTRKKTYPSVLEPMGVIRETIAETREDRKRLSSVPFFAPAGQSTQMIIGASPESDFEILHLAGDLYRRQALKRVYYSAYVPVAQPGSRLPDIGKPPLRRENRLYQADWLIRLYGFSLDEVIDRESPFLDLQLDPKQTFALRHPALFPVDINTADHEMILRVPGIGLRSAARIVTLRRRGRIRFEHLKQMGVAIRRAIPFIRCDGLSDTQWTVDARAQHRLTREQSASRARIENGNDLETRRIYEIDGTFDGLLTAIFAAYDGEHPPDVVESRGRLQTGLFDHRIDIPTDPVKAERVWKGLGKRMGHKPRRLLFDAWLSASPGIETLIYHVVRNAIPDRKNSRNTAHLTANIQVERLAQKVRREAHRMKGFIRFQQTGDDRYVALISPRYDVLPMIRRHFESRFADQCWIIYDIQRDYGICYDTRQTREIRLAADELTTSSDAAIDGEELCQELWRRYYKAVNIEARDNPRLHQRHLPRRYWRFLIEKQSR